MARESDRAVGGGWKKGEEDDMIKDGCDGNAATRESAVGAFAETISQRDR
jgi:hypothetical protein